MNTWENKERTVTRNKSEKKTTLGKQREKIYKKTYYKNKSGKAKRTSQTRKKKNGIQDNLTCRIHISRKDYLV